MTRARAAAAAADAAARDVDGGSALSTVYLAALQRASGLKLVVCNTSFVCWRKGEHGNEKVCGAAGCH